MKLFALKVFIGCALILMTSCSEGDIGAGEPNLSKEAVADQVSMSLYIDGFQNSEIVSDDLSFSLFLRDGSVRIDPDDISEGGARETFVFSNLEKGLSYELNIDIKGYLPQKKYLYFDQNTDSKVNIQVMLQSEDKRLEGQVKSPDGEPIARVLVRCGKFYTESDLNGAFSLGVTEKVNCTFFRQSYPSLKLDPDKIKEVILVPEQLSPRLILADQLLPLGLTSGHWKKQLQTLLEDTGKKGWKTQFWSESEIQLNPLSDTLWLASPQRALSEAVQTQIIEFVAAGGKLLVTGEWAGFEGVELTSLQKLLSVLGLELGGDTLFQEAKALSVTEFGEHFITENLNEIKLYRSASVHVFEPVNTQLLGWSKSSNYRIVSNSRQAVLAIGYYGLGRIVLLGDTSLWLEQKEQGESHYGSADNALLWQKILEW